MEYQRSLDWMERRLDGDLIAQTIARHKAAMRFEALDRAPLITQYPLAELASDTLKAGFGDPAIMLLNELSLFQSNVLVQDDRIPAIRANHGVGILPSLFGAESRFLQPDVAPWVDPLSGDPLEIISRLVDTGVPDVQTGLGARVLDTMAFYREAMAPYPNCSKNIRIYHPDLQGPFDVAHLLLHTEIYYLMEDEPEAVHALLSLITNAYIALMRACRQLCTDDLDGFTCHWGGLCGGYVALRDDTAVNLSRERFEVFVKPYNERIFAAFDGGSIHYCGRADQWDASMIATKGLLALQYGNFGTMPNVQFGQPLIDRVYPALSRQRVAAVSYWLDPAEYDDFDLAKYSTGLTFTVPVQNEADARVLLEQHKHRAR